MDFDFKGAPFIKSAPVIKGDFFKDCCLTPSQGKGAVRIEDQEKELEARLKESFLAEGTAAEAEQVPKDSNEQLNPAPGVSVDPEP